MNTSMAFNRMMSRSEVIEKYGIPKEWEETVFRELQTIGSGTNEKYLKHDVDETLQRVFGAKNRPLSAALESSLKREDSSMQLNAVAVEQLVGNLERVARMLATAQEKSALTDMDPVLSPRDAAEALGLNEQTVREYCRNKVFGTRLHNGRWAIRRSEIDHYLKGQRVIHGRGVA